MSPAPRPVAFVDSTRATMVAIFGEAKRVDIRNHEEATAGELVSALTQPVMELVDRAIRLASELLAQYDRAPDAGPAPEGDGVEFNFELAVDTVVAGEHQDAGNKVADLAFMALAELRARRSRLGQHDAQGEAWQMVCDCGSALRRVQKSLAALELALCEAEGVPRLLEYDSELEVSLQVRRQYRKLWRFVTSAGDVGTEEVRNALRGGGTLLAMLVGRDVYCRLRERDRFQLRQLQRRILAWLGQPQPDPRAGVRLWQDFAGFVEMLRQVNLRQELRDHDASALRIALAALRSDDEPAPPGALAVLQRVQGLDDGLDDTLELIPCPTAALRVELERLLPRLTGADTTQSPF